MAGIPPASLTRQFVSFCSLTRGYLSVCLKTIYTDLDGQKVYEKKRICHKAERGFSEGKSSYIGKVYRTSYLGYCLNLNRISLSTFGNPVNPYLEKPVKIFSNKLLECFVTASFIFMNNQEMLKVLEMIISNSGEINEKRHWICGVVNSASREIGFHWDQMGIRYKKNGRKTHHLLTLLYFPPLCNSGNFVWAFRVS